MSKSLISALFANRIYKDNFLKTFLKEDVKKPSIGQDTWERLKASKLVYINIPATDFIANISATIDAIQAYAAKSVELKKFKDYLDTLRADIKDRLTPNSNLVAFPSKDVNEDTPEHEVLASANFPVSLRTVYRDIITNSKGIDFANYGVSKLAVERLKSFIETQLEYMKSEYEKPDRQSLQAVIKNPEQFYKVIVPVRPDESTVLKPLNLNHYAEEKSKEGRTLKNAIFNITQDLDSLLASPAVKNVVNRETGKHVWPEIEKYFSKGKVLFTDYLKIALFLASPEDFKAFIENNNLINIIGQTEKEFRARAGQRYTNSIYSIRTGGQDNIFKDANVAYLFTRIKHSEPKERNGVVVNQSLIDQRNDIATSVKEIASLPTEFYRGRFSSSTNTNIADNIYYSIISSFGTSKDLQKLEKLPGIPDKTEGFLTPDARRHLQKDLGYVSSKRKLGEKVTDIIDTSFSSDYQVIRDVAQTLRMSLETLHSETNKGYEYIFKALSRALEQHKILSLVENIKTLKDQALVDAFREGMFHNIETELGLVGANSLKLMFASSSRKELLSPGSKNIFDVSRAVKNKLIETKKAIEALTAKDLTTIVSVLSKSNEILDYSKKMQKPLEFSTEFLDEALATCNKLHMLVMDVNDNEAVQKVIMDSAEALRKGEYSLRTLNIIKNAINKDPELTSNEGIATCLVKLDNIFGSSTEIEQYNELVKQYLEIKTSIKNLISYKTNEKISSDSDRSLGFDLVIHPFDKLLQNINNWIELLDEDEIESWREQRKEGVIKSEEDIKDAIISAQIRMNTERAQKEAAKRRLVPGSSLSGNAYTTTEQELRKVFEANLRQAGDRAKEFYNDILKIVESDKKFQEYLKYAGKEEFDEETGEKKDAFNDEELKNYLFDTFSKVIQKFQSGLATENPELEAEMAPIQAQALQKTDRPGGVLRDGISGKSRTITEFPDGSALTIFKTTPSKELLDNFSDLFPDATVDTFTDYRNGKAFGHDGLRLADFVTILPEAEFKIFKERLRAIESKKRIIKTKAFTTFSTIIKNAIDTGNIVYPVRVEIASTITNLDLKSSAFLNIATAISHYEDINNFTLGNHGRSADVINALFNMSEYPVILNQDRCVALAVKCYILELLLDAIKKSSVDSLISAASINFLDTSTTENVKLNKEATDIFRSSVAKAIEKDFNPTSGTFAKEYEVTKKMLLSAIDGSANAVSILVASGSIVGKTTINPKNESQVEGIIKSRGIAGLSIIKNSDKTSDSVKLFITKLMANTSTIADNLKATVNIITSGISYTLARQALITSAQKNNERVSDKLEEFDRNEKWVQFTSKFKLTKDKIANKSVIVQDDDSGASNLRNIYLNSFLTDFERLFKNIQKLKIDRETQEVEETEDQSAFDEKQEIEATGVAILGLYQSGETEKLQSGSILPGSEAEKLVNKQRSKQGDSSVKRAIKQGGTVTLPKSMVKPSKSGGLEAVVNLSVGRTYKNVTKELLSGQSRSMDMTGIKGVAKASFNEHKNIKQIYDSIEAELVTINKILSLSCGAFENPEKAKADLFEYSNNISRSVTIVESALRDFYIDGKVVFNKKEVQAAARQKLTAIPHPLISPESSFAFLLHPDLGKQALATHESSYKKIDDGIKEHWKILINSLLVDGKASIDEIFTAIRTKFEVVEAPLGKTELPEKPAQEKVKFSVEDLTNFEDSFFSNAVSTKVLNTFVVALLDKYKDVEKTSPDKLAKTKEAVNASLVKILEFCGQKIKFFKNLLTSDMDAVSLQTKYNDSIQPIVNHLFTLENIINAVGLDGSLSSSVDAVEKELDTLQKEMDSRKTVESILYNFFKVINEVNDAGNDEAAIMQKDSELLPTAGKSEEAKSKKYDFSKNSTIDDIAKDYKFIYKNSAWDIIFPNIKNEFIAVFVTEFVRGPLYRHYMQSLFKSAYYIKVLAKAGTINEESVTGKFLISIGDFELLHDFANGEDLTDRAIATK
jgi:hypothetical protein